ncbi:MAG: polyphosphate kinase 1 [Ruminococcus flavefaciens]|nr:polyphosphate kinase 1 [Ruminococcus flavefaciens]
MKFLNRNLSALSFNYRVADEGGRKRNLLGSRVQFLGIASSNLNEFMQVRYPAVITDEPETVELVADGAIQQYKTFATKFQEFNKQFKIVRKISSLTKEQKKWAEEHFRKNVFPALLPITVDTARQANIHSGMYLLVITEHNDEKSIGYIEIPSAMPRFIQVPDEHYVISIEDLIQSNMKSIISGRKILTVCPFAILRSAEVYMRPDRYMDPYQLIKETLKERERSWITQLEIGSDQKSILKTIQKFLPLDDNTIIFTANMIRLSDLKTIPFSVYRDKDRPEQFEPIQTFPQDDIFQYIRNRDRLCFHPFESYDGSVVRFIEEAADDPDVLSIRICLYRVSERSRIVDALMRAADNGKLVIALIELKARFDEKHNMQLATIMREAGIRIVYTKPDIKTHAKLCLVGRNEKKGLRIYSHVGTGNYSETNSRLYTDYSYFTADQRVGIELTQFFNLLTSDQGDFKSRKVVYAPYNLKQTIIDGINRQIKLAKKGKKAQIIIKCNALTDEGVAERLIEAAKAGVKLQLIIRSACVIQPQKNIQIYSIVGRFLEHSRVYVFGSGKDADVYIGSADLMTRNLSRRNELLILIENKDMQSRIRQHISWYLRDNVNRREIKRDYKYALIKPDKGEKIYNCHQNFIKEAKDLEDDQ